MDEGYRVRMHFDLIQTLSLAGSPDTPNDDRAGMAERHAWVIDGATDLGPPGLIGERGGAAWLATAEDNALAGAAGSMDDITGHLFDQVTATFARDARRAPESAWELPTASLAVVAIEGDSLTCGFIGDCSVLHRHGDTISFLTPRPDRARESAEAAALGPGIGATKLRTPAVLADRRAARERASRRVLGVDATHSRAAIEYGRSKVAPGDELLLMSDGFVALIDSYGRYEATSLFDAVHAHGLAALATELRTIEAEDAACLRFPRFKASDDATALWLRIA